jgi:hypothetical protein
MPHDDLPGGRIRKLLEVMTVGIGGLVIAPLSLISNVIVKLINSCASECDTIAFTSGFDYSGAPKWLIAGLCDLFLYAPITVKCNAKGHKVKWVKNVKKNTILNMLADE